MIGIGLFRFADGLVDVQVEGFATELAALGLLVVDVEGAGHDIGFRERIFDDNLAGDFDVAEVIHAGSGKDLGAHDDVFVETAEVAHLAVDGGFGEDMGGPRMDALVAQCRVGLPCGKRQPSALFVSLSPGKRI